MRRSMFFALALVAAPLAARADDHPYQNAKVGDFVTYSMSTKVAGFNLAGTITQVVTEKTDKEVTVKASGSIDFMGKEQKVPETTQKIDLTKPFDPTKTGGNVPGGADAKVEKVSEGKEKIKVGGKEYDCTWTTYNVTAKAMGQEFKTEMKTWMSKGVTAGMVKMEMKGDVAGQKMEMTMELKETGNKK